MSRTNRKESYKKAPKHYVPPAKDRQNARDEILEEWEEWEDTETSNEDRHPSYSTEEHTRADGNGT